ncbi:MAG: FtsX-like permease family protein [Ruminococcaceae bacterium]|nr:FtsX-like permease family protein [Oscillospiraceae bacterium]
MNVKENIRIAIYSIQTNLMRSLLTMLGIIIGVASVISIITVGNGGRDYIVGMIREMGSNAIQIGVDATVASNSDYITDKDIEAIKALDSVQYVSPAVMGMGSMSTDSEVGIGILMGGNEYMRYVTSGDCVYGRYFTAAEADAGRAVCVIDTSAALQFFGKKNCVGEYINFTLDGITSSIKIIGVTDMASSFGGDSEQMAEQMKAMGGSAISGGMILVPLKYATAAIGMSDRYDTVYIIAKNESELEEAGNAALNRIRARHNNYDRDCYMLTNMATYIDLLDTVINIFTIFIAAVSAISLIVGGIGVMNIMLVSITERTREIGIRKALGAKTSNILFQFLTESVILCIIGGTIGLLLGVSGAALVSSIMKIPLQVKLSTVVLAIGFSSFIGIIFGVYPARRAAKMPPIEALRRD